MQAALVLEQRMFLGGARFGVATVGGHLGGVERGLSAGAPLWAA